MSESNENEFIDETVLAWVEENKENLQSLYKSYCEEMEGEICTFEEFTMYMFYEAGH